MSKDRLIDIIKELSQEITTYQTWSKEIKLDVDRFLHNRRTNI